MSTTYTAKTNEFLPKGARKRFAVEKVSGAWGVVDRITGSFRVTYPTKARAAKYAQLANRDYGFK